MKPTKLHLKAFLSHRNSLLDLESIDSALLVGNIDGDYSRSNGSGKSAIFEAMLWALFNKTRAGSMNDVIMWGERECSVSIEFISSGITYKVARTRDRVKSTSSVKFSSFTNGSWIDESGSTAGLTNSKIISAVKFDYKTFINSVYFRQNDISEFSASDASTKKNILKSILDISRWDSYEQAAKKELKEAKFELEQLEQECLETASIENKILEMKDEVERLSSNIDSNSRNAEILYECLSHLKTSFSISKLKNDSNEVSSMRNRLSSKESELRVGNRSIASFKSELKSVESRISTISSKLVLTSNNMLKLNIIDNDESMLSDYYDENAELRGSIIKLKSAIEEFNSRDITDGECYVCKQEITELLYSKLITEKCDGTSNAIKNIELSTKRLKEVSDESLKLKSSIKARNDKKMAERLIDSLKSELDILKLKASTISKNITLTSIMVKSLENEISIITNGIASIETEDLSLMEVKISTKSKELRTVNLNINNWNIELGILTEKIETTSKELSRLKNIKNLIKPKAKNVSAIAKMVKLYGKTGIQTILLNSIIQDLQVTSNGILNTISGDEYSIILDTQRLHSDGVSIVETLDLKIRKDGIVQGFTSLSGGEQFRVSLALRIALSEISSRHSGSSIDFLLLDEISSPLDKHGTETLFVEIIKSLEERYKVLVITHDDFLKEKFNKVIKVSKLSGESVVELISR